MALQHKRSSIANKRPVATSLSDGQLAINVNASSPGVFFKNSSNVLTKVGPVHIGTSAPNSSPATGGSTGNSIGEQWLDTTGGAYVLKIWDGSAWRSESGTFVDVSGDTMTGALILPSGSASAPALGVGSSDNGLYLPATDTLGVSTNGSERLRIDSSGNVGIGTSSPQAKLDVNSDSNDGVFAIIRGTKNALGNSSIRRLKFFNPAFRMAIQAQQGATTVNNSDLLLNPDGGDVGIGLLVPAAKLHVKTADTAGGTLAMFDDNGSGSTGRLQLMTTGGTGSDEIRIAGVNRNLGFGSASSSHVLIDGSSGNVGIGTSSPQKPFNIVAAETELIRLSQAVDSGTQQEFGIGWAASNTQTHPSAKITTKEFDTADSRASLLFYTRGSNTDSAPDERMRIDSSGKVGIGTTSPTYTLDVEKTADTAIRVRATGTGSTDDSYVRLSIGGTSASNYILFGDGADGDVGRIRYQHSTDRMFFRTNTEDRLTINSSGSVGIGTTGPSSLLHLASNAPYITFEDKDNNQDWQLQATAWFALRNQTTSSELLRVTPAGLVGIGTSSPATKLEVDGTILSTPVNYGNNKDEAYLIAGTSGYTGATTNWDTFGIQHRIKSNSSGTPRVTIDTNNGEVLCVNSAGNVGIGTTAPSFSAGGGLHVEAATQGTIRVTETGNTGVEIQQRSGGSGVLNVIDNANLVLQTGNTERMRIRNSGGNVGIGTSSPNTPLQVHSSTTASTIRLTNSTSGATSSDGLIIQESGNEAYIWNKENSFMSFGTNNNERMRITSSGRVGIGNSSPSQILDVQGNIRLSGQLYQSTPSDFWSPNSTFIEISGMGNLTHMGSYETCLTSNGYRDTNDQWQSYAANSFTGASQIRLNPQGHIVFATESNKANGSSHTVQARVLIDSSGNVGINTTSPDACLEIASGAVSTFPTLYLSRAPNINTTSDIALTSNSVIRSENSIRSVVNTGGHFSWWIGGTDNKLGLTGATEVARIDSSGKLGIGLSIPRALFHVKSSSIGIPAAGVAGSMQVGDGTSFGLMLGTNTSGVGYIQPQRNDGGTTTYNLALNPNGGNVGINRSSPNYALDVEGTADTAIRVRTTGTGSSDDSLLRLSIAGTTASNYIYFGDNNDADVGWIRYRHNSNSMQFRVNATEAMRIDSSGNALVGTTTMGGSGGITLRNDGFIIAEPIYSLTVTASPRDIYMDSSGYFGYISSVRESKANIQVQENIDWIYQLEPVTFNYKTKDRETGEYTGNVESELEYGLIAEDVEAVSPDLCFYDETDNGSELRGVHYKKLITPMLKALQDAKTKIETLEQRLADAGIA